MTQSEITTKLMKLKYEGNWTYRGLAKETGLDKETVRLALAGKMSEKAQIRLANCLPLIHSRPAKIKKNKPGKFKRFLIRYYNLRKWCLILGDQPEVKKKYAVSKRHDMTLEEAGYTCAKLDFIMKSYLMDIFGSEFKKRRGTFGDGLPAERWVVRIKNILPGVKTELIKKIETRKEQYNERSN